MRDGEWFDVLLRNHFRREQRGLDLVEATNVEESSQVAEQIGAATDGFGCGHPQARDAERRVLRYDAERRNE